MKLKYKVVQAATIENLEREVQSYCCDGWVPSGSIAIVTETTQVSSKSIHVSPKGTINTVYLQPMTFTPPPPPMPYMGPR